MKLYSLYLLDFKNCTLVGWGQKPSSLKVKMRAKKMSLPFIALEDGFLRSYSTGESCTLLSLVCDQKGIYYNSLVISDLESILISKLNLFSINNSNITAAKRLIMKNFLSKYNHAGSYFSTSSINCKKSKILLVDQTFGDMSVKFGGAYPRSFVDMLNAALAENPEATIYIKTHPEVTSGRKKGYLTHIQDSDRILMIRDDVNPIDLIQKMDKVYVVTSQMGFEALMCGKPVVCFGVPWYAGWGVTDDRVKDSPAWARRSKKRTVDELFAAAYLHYTRYLNPFTHERGTIFDVIEWLVLQKKMVANQFKRAL